jgi:hypothetical protein
MSNPLIDKFYELHPEKKEKPKKVEFEGTAKLSQEQIDIVSKYLTDPKNYSTTSVTTQTITNPNSVGAITSSNHIPPTFKTLTSYDPSGGGNTFLEVANKIQKGDARVIGMSVNMENFRKSYTFEVDVYH